MTRTDQIPKALTLNTLYCVLLLSMCLNKTIQFCSKAAFFVFIFAPDVNWNAALFLCLQVIKNNILCQFKVR